jgi:hypothetical protein
VLAAAKESAHTANVLLEQQDVMNAAQTMLSLKRTTSKAGAEFSCAKKCFLAFVCKTQMGHVDLPNLLIAVLSDISEHLGCHWSIG